MFILKSTNQFIPQICQLLTQGVVVAAPTETAFGLMTNALNKKAVAQIIKIKGRTKSSERNKPIALVASDLSMVKKYFYLNKAELDLAKKFWPGALTILLKPKIKFLRTVTGPHNLVGVRVPDQAWLCKLIKTFSRPLTATSANLASQPALYNFQNVIRALGKNGLEYVVEGNLRRNSVSTVIKVVNDKIIILRQGKVKIPKTQIPIPKI
ncbi:MAG: L-threonylcarbamoyladenylate synthase [Patescibacteria group bacterium]